jgi:beta-glucosidase
MPILAVCRSRAWRSSVLGLLAIACALRGHVVQSQNPEASRLDNCKAPAVSEPWRDRQQTAECRTLEMIHAMKLEEKISHVVERPKADRFAIPSLNPADGPNGFARGPIPGPPPPSALGVTAFPNEIALAATWDRNRASDFGKALGEEWRGKGSSEIVGPTLNIMRTWHWGRSAETFGEDPFLNGKMAAAEVAAIQKEHVIAMVKHFAGNNQDWDRVGHFPDFIGINEIISERALHEIYYPGFRAAIQTAGAAGAMCAYNQINGSFACNNEKVLGQLRQWGFIGAVTPDAVFALHDPLVALRAGVTFVGPEKLLEEMVAQGQLTEQTIDRMLYDVLFPIFKLGIYDEPAPGKPTAHVSTSEHVALSRRILEESSVLLKNKDHLLPISAGKVKSVAIIGVAAGPEAIVGEEGPTVYVEKLSVPAEALAARAGPAMKVSYHGVGVGLRALPTLEGDMLSPSSGFGHGLTATYFRSGDLSGEPAVTRIDASVDVHGLPAPQLGQATFSFGPPKLSWSARWTGTLAPPSTGEYMFSLDGAGTARLMINGKIVAQLQKVNFRSIAFGSAHLTAGTPVKLVIEHSNDYALLGSALHLGWYPPRPDELAAALQVAQAADIAVVFAGEQLGEGMDKTSLPLPGNQDALIEAVAAHNPHTVVVLNTSTPVAMPWLDKVNAVVEAWYPGQESGAGIAAVLFGDADPGGRLPMTFPASPEQGPGADAVTYPGVNGKAEFKEGVLVGYRWYDQHQQTPLFPFGFGLSYTTFQYSGLRVKRIGDTVSVSVTLKNTGSRTGSDVVQVYVGEPKCAEEPPSQLKGFEKVVLDSGETRTANLQIPLDSLAGWSEKSNGWNLCKGRYAFKVGQSSRTILMSSSIMLGE